MFARIGSNAAESTEGFSVRRLSHNALEYTSGGRYLEIEVEPGEALAVYRSTLKTWLPPHDVEPLSEDERDVILSRVSAALRFLKIDHVLA
jgi:hypothetical protein